MSRPLPRTAVAAAALAIINGGYLVIDAIHRFVVGDFLRIGGELGAGGGFGGGVRGDPPAGGPGFLLIGGAPGAGAPLFLLPPPGGGNLLLPLPLRGPRGP